MATIQLTNGRDVDEQKLLGLPEGTKPHGGVLRAAMRAVGYEVPTKATRAAMLVQVYEGKAATRFALQKELRSQFGVAEEPTPAAKDKRHRGTAEMSVDEMRTAISRKGYTGTIPTKRSDVAGLYAAIVEQGVIPHSYPTGTRLQDVVAKPYTNLRVTPDADQPLTQVELAATASAGRQMAEAAFGIKANRLGLFVRIEGDLIEDADNVWRAMVTIVPKDAATV